MGFHATNDRVPANLEISTSYFYFLRTMNINIVKNIRNIRCHSMMDGFTNENEFKCRF